MRTSKIFVTVDAVVFRKLSTHLELLLIQRKNEPFKEMWALPGGFLDENEDMEQACLRELREETGIAVAQMEQVQAFGTPGRDPRGHMISIAFYGFVDADATVKAADDAADARWFPIDDLPQMAFDHAEIVTFTRSKYTI